MEVEHEREREKERERERLKLWPAVFEIVNIELEIIIFTSVEEALNVSRI